MKELYTENDLAALRAQISRRMKIMLIPAILLLASGIFFFITRIEAAASASFVLLAFTIIFTLEFLCRPLRCYAKHMDAALHGRTHEISVVYRETEQQTSVVDGVSFLSLIFLGEPDKHGIRETMFYWDQELPLPDFKPDDTVTLKYYDKNIIGYRTA